MVRNVTVVALVIRPSKNKFYVRQSLRYWAAILSYHNMGSLNYFNISINLTSVSGSFVLGLIAAGLAVDVVSGRSIIYEQL